MKRLSSRRLARRALFYVPVSALVVCWLSSSIAAEQSGLTNTQSSSESGNADACVIQIQDGQCADCPDTVQTFTKDLKALTEALANPTKLENNLLSGVAVVPDVSPAFLMALRGDKITAKQCRKTCVEAGGDANLCRVVCSQLKNSTCCGVWALITHMLRHGQKQAAEALLLVYNVLCKGMK